jgi:hypothetical protein
MTVDAPPFTLPADAVNAIAHDVMHFGKSDVETGGFLIARRSDAYVITTVAVAGETGISRHPRMFRISAKAIDVLFARSDEYGYHIPAQFHSHGATAFLSDTDRRDGFNVTGFISCVVPSYLDPPRDHTRWGWWEFQGQMWMATSPPTVGTNAVKLIVFDEDGVRP